MSRNQYVIIDTANNEVWNHRTQQFSKRMTRGCLYASVTVYRRRGGSRTHPTAKCEKMHNLLHCSEENLHRRLEIQSMDYMRDDPIKRDITINI